MSIKVRVLSDLHVHAFKQFANYRGSDNSRRLEILERLDSIVSSPDITNFDLLIIAGDIFHEKTKIDVVSVVEVEKIISKSKIPILMCSGNHDQTYSGYSSLATIATNTPFQIDKNLYPGNVAYYDTYAVVTDPDTDFKLLFNAVPYNSFFEYATGADTLGKKMGIDEVLISHGELQGVVGSYEIDGVPINKLQDNFHFSIIGHQHSIIPSMNNGNSWVLIPGAIIPHTFGETDCGYLWDIEFYEEGNVWISSHKFEHPRFITVDFREGSFPYTFDSRDYYRVIFKSQNDILQIPQEISERVVAVHGDENVGMIGSFATEVLELSPSSLVDEYFKLLVERGAVDNNSMLSKIRRFGLELVSEGSNIDSLCEELEREDTIHEDGN